MLYTGPTGEDLPIKHDQVQPLCFIPYCNRMSQWGADFYLAPPLAWLVLCRKGCQSSRGAGRGGKLLRIASEKLPSGVTLWPFKLM